MEGSVTPRRVVVIGDVGGHLDVFRAALAAAGVDRTSCLLPAGLAVVQVGDLVHKGPDSAGCVQLADRLLAGNPGRYVQLFGNHEGHYLGGPDLSGRAGVADVGAATRTILERWWRTGQARMAVAVTGPGDEAGTLITHGGLTAGLWHELGAPTTAAEAAARVNELARDPGLAFRPGWLMTGRLDYAAGVTNPRTGAELAASWLEEGQMPFSQVHGHEGVWWWPAGRWHADVPERVRARSYVDHATRHSTVAIGSRTLTSVDWVLGASATAPSRGWRPHTMAGTLAGGDRGDSSHAVV